MVNNGLIADNIRNVLIKEMNRKISFPNAGLFYDNQIGVGGHANSEVIIRREISSNLDEINADRIRYLLNIDDALIEILI